MSWSTKVDADKKGDTLPEPLGPLDGFTYVTHASKTKKKKNRKGRWQQEGESETQSADGRLQRRREIILQRKDELRKNDALNALLDHILPYEPTTDDCLTFGKALSLGLGSVKDARPAQVQLAFFLLICERLGIVDMQAYDPIWTEEDASLLLSLNITCLSDNAHGRYSLQRSDDSSQTFVFMPHCTRWLYENLLQANWRPEALESILLCCNELERYVEESAQDNTLMVCIRRSVPFLHVYPVPVLVTGHLANSLNDLAFQSYGSLPRLSQGGTKVSPFQDQPAAFWLVPALGNDTIESQRQDAEFV